MRVSHVLYSVEARLSRRLERCLLSPLSRQERRVMSALSELNSVERIAALVHSRSESMKRNLNEARELQTQRAGEQRRRALQHLTYLGKFSVVINVCRGAALVVAQVGRWAAAKMKEEEVAEFLENVNGRIGDLRREIKKKAKQSSGPRGYGGIVSEAYGSLRERLTEFRRTPGYRVLRRRARSLLILLLRVMQVVIPAAGAVLLAILVRGYIAWSRTTTQHEEDNFGSLLHPSPPHNDSHDASARWSEQLSRRSLSRGSSMLRGSAPRFSSLPRTPARGGPGGPAGGPTTTTPVSPFVPPVLRGGAPAAPPPRVGARAIL